MNGVYMKRLYKILLVLFVVPSALQAITPQQAKKLENQFLQVGIYNPKKPNDYNETLAKRILDTLDASPTFKSRAIPLRNAQQKSLLLRIPSAAAAQVPTATQTRGIATFDQNKLQQLYQANSQLQTQLKAEREQAITLKQQAQAINQQNQQLYNKITLQDQQFDYIKQQLTQTQQQNTQLQQQVAQLQPLAQSAKNLVPTLRKQNQEKEALISSAQQQNTQLQQQVTQLRSQSKQKEEALLLQLQAESQASQNLSAQLEQTQKQLQSQALQQQELAAQQLKNTQLRQQHQAQLQKNLNEQLASAEKQKNQALEQQKYSIQQEFTKRLRTYQETSTLENQKQIDELKQNLNQTIQQTQQELKKQQAEFNTQLQQQLNEQKKQLNEQYQNQLQQQREASIGEVNKLKKELQSLQTAQTSWNDEKQNLNLQNAQLQQSQKQLQQEQKASMNQVTRLQQELQNLRTAQTSWNSDRQNLNEQNQQLQAQNQQAQQALKAQQETSIQKINQLTNQHQKEKDNFKQKEQTLSQELIRLRTEQTSWDSDRQNLNEQNQQLQQQLQLAKQQQKEQQAQLNQQKENFESQINRLNEEKNNLEQNLEAKLKIPQEEIKNLTIEILGLKEELKTKDQATEQALQKSQEQKHQALIQLKEKHKKEQQELSEQLNVQKNDNDRLRQELTYQKEQLASDIEKLRSAQTSWNKEKQALSNERQQLQIKVEQQQQTNQQANILQKELNEQEQANALLKKQIEEEKVKCQESLKKQKTAYQKELTNTNQKHLKALNAQKEVSGKVLKATGNKLIKLKTENNQLNKQLNTQKQSIERLKQEIPKGKTSTPIANRAETSTYSSRMADANSTALRLLAQKALKTTTKTWEDVGIYFFNKTSNTLDVWKDKDNNNPLAISPKLHVTQLDKLPFKAGKIKNALYYKSHGDLIGLLASEYTIERNEIEDKAEEAFQVTGNILITITPTTLGYAKKIEIFNPTTIKPIEANPELAKNFPRIAKAQKEFSWRNWTFEDFLTQKPHFVLDIDKKAQSDAVKLQAGKLRNIYKNKKDIVNAIDTAAYYMTKQPPTFQRKVDQLELAKNLDIDQTNVRFGQQTYQLKTPTQPRIAIEQAQIQKALPETPGAGTVAKEQQELVDKIKEEQKLVNFGDSDKKTELSDAGSSWTLLDVKQKEATSPLMSKNYTKEQVRILTEWVKGGINPEGWCGEQYEKNGTILLYTIHGTWSNKAAFGGDITTLSTYYIFKFACQLARSKQRRVKIVSVSWSGALAPKDRTDKAEQLATHCLQQWKENNIKETWMIGHSHGCNVAAMTANNIFDATKKQTGTGKLVDVGIFLACPTLQVQRPLDFNLLYAFYAQGDFTQVAGSAELGYNFNRKMPLAQPGSGRKVYNVRTMLDSYDLDHVSIKWAVMPYLAKILTTINTDYPHNFDLEMNVKSDLKTWPTIAIRNKGPQYRSQIDAQAWIKDKLARNAFQKEYNRDMRRIGNFYLSGVTWLLNLAREGWSAFQGEPTLGNEYLQATSGSATQSTPNQQSSSSSSSSSNQQSSDN